VLPVVPIAVEDYGIYIIILAVAGVLYASCIAWVQSDLKRLFAYSSIAHVGLIAAGIFTVTEQGLQGAMVQMVAHGINVVGLFYVCQVLFRKFGNHNIDALGGLRLKAPVFAGLYLTVALASVALPLTNAFPGEFMLLSSVFTINGWLCLLGGSGVVLGAVYMFNSYRRVMLGEANEKVNVFSEISALDKWVLIPVVLLIFILGINPGIITSITDYAVNQIIDTYNSDIIDLSIY
jgi:NADH-quinone oxidoreductase subunit M